MGVMLIIYIDRLFYLYYHNYQKNKRLVFLIILIYFLFKISSILYLSFFGGVFPMWFKN
jgi:hypothetical protein